MTRPTLIITGASRGLGAEIVRAAARRETNLVLAARSASALRDLALELRTAPARPEVLAVPCDLARLEDCQAVVRRALDAFDHIDALVNNAAQVEPLARIDAVRLNEWERAWQVNLLAPLALTQLALPALRQSGGRVINISSGAAEVALAGWSAYSAAKAALNHLTRILAAEEPSITALAVRPGILDTEMQAEIRARGGAAMSEGDYRRVLEDQTQGRLVPPEVPARVIAQMAFSAPHEWSGQVLRWNEEKVKAWMDAE